MEFNNTKSQLQSDKQQYRNLATNIFLYINDQFSLGLFVSHRFFMQVVSLIFLNFFGIDIDLFRDVNSRFEAILISIV